MLDLFVLLVKRACKKIKGVRGMPERLRMDKDTDKRNNKGEQSRPGRAYAAAAGGACAGLLLLIMPFLLAWAGCAGDGDFAGLALFWLACAACARAEASARRAIIGAALGAAAFAASLAYQAGQAGCPGLQAQLWAAADAAAVMLFAHAKGVLRFGRC